MTPDEREFVALVGELVALEQDGGFTPLTLNLGPYSGFVLVSALQLAWRHPAQDGRLKDLIERIARRVQDGYPPEYAQLLELGWHVDLDVEVSR